MKHITYRELPGRSGYYGLLGALALVVLMGFGAFLYMEHHGHYVTGMNNQVVWGTPHVFAVFLIVAASGVLNMASIGSVFGKSMYKPLGRMAGLLAITLLMGGLTVLVLDLGHPDRLIVAMTHYNFKSIFAWNIFLYTGFMAIVAVYLWSMMERRMNPYSKPMGFLAFVWRLMLTTGTGSIFGFLVARQGYDAAVMAPMFIAMSFSFGLAIFLLVLRAMEGGFGWELGGMALKRYKNLLGVFIAATLYFVALMHLTNLYATEHHGVEAFILMNGGIYTFLFWVVFVLVGSLLPLGLLYHPATGGSRTWITAASVLVLVGAIALVYVIIIGGQAYPLVLFPGMEVSSSFNDGVVNSYAPSLPEVVLGVGGIALALALAMVAMRVLRFIPETMSDEAMQQYLEASKH
ncbi:NrfD/PsrC family molybdoenzyme membrane anchor subunit [Thioalbus denitrificans]|uniref:Molybdopterin-containing oxidoreductase family membrane subunit n=1 Tax=Thioalbus denitrificans TaxID=547122 RepID=A0A369CD87_9GAMM|nr:NrfD/PsrC family molybdoenzyme membrane anchor subunit [Thioalbus denitrificans]RCX31960.1 molybdopterin-containing oxidoreductase family membrane subunit [Thioalbus denitrificans]